MKNNLASFRSIFLKIEKMHFIVIFHHAFSNVKTLKTAKMPKNTSLKIFYKIPKTIQNMLK